MMTIMLRSKIYVSIILAIQILDWHVAESAAPLPAPSDKYHRDIESFKFEGPSRQRDSPTVAPVRLTQEFLKATPPDQMKRYIVILHDQINVSKFVSDLKKSFDLEDDPILFKNKIGYVYESAILHGFSVQLKLKSFDELSRSAEVLQILDDTVVKIQPIEEIIFDQLPTSDFQPQAPNITTVDAESVYDGFIQKGTAPWGLQRIDQRNKIGNNSPAAATNYDYSYSLPSGDGVIVYILDTGVRESHTEFGGRAEMAAQFGGYDLEDGNGHGTHCAGIVGGSRWGVAKQVSIRAVKVLGDDGGGTTSDVIAGVQYTLQQYQASGYQPTVVSLSLGGERNSALDRAVQSAVNQGIHFVVAAGNSNADACLYSPAAVSGANVVAASDIRDNRASYSNWGTCVDLIAPGSEVTSSWCSSDDATKRISGTSMAAPHVAGLIAAHLSRQNMTTQQMTDKLRRDATVNAIYLNSRNTTPNLLLYNTLQ